MAELTETLQQPDSPANLKAHFFSAPTGKAGEPVAYDLTQVLEEYALLRKVIFEVLEAEGELRREERDTILDAVQCGMKACAGLFQRRSDAASLASQGKLTETQNRFDAAIGESAAEIEQAHEALRRSEERYELVSRATRDTIWDWDLRADTVVWNRALVTELGYGVENLKSTGAWWSDLIHPRDRARILALMQETIKSSRSYWACEYDVRRADGTYISVLDRAYIVRDGEGKGTRMIGAMQDQTARKRAEESVAFEKKKFEDLANALPQIVYTAQPDALVDWYNDWWYEYLGMPRGTRWDDAATLPMHPDDIVRTQELWPRVVAAGLPFNMEQRFRRGSDGEYRWHLVRAVPIKDAAGKVIKYVGANTDIHDHKQALEELVAERALRERFTNALTHDLRNPITAAKMSAQLLLRHGANPAAVERHAFRILSAVDRADHMISDLLDANRIKAGERLPIRIDHCDLAQVVIHAVDDLNLSHGERISYAGADRCDGYWSSEALRRVLDNLIGNALKYGAPGTPIKVGLECREEIARIHVHNEGNELDAEDLAQLFTMFRRAKKAEASELEGWGIGLTLVKGIAQSHGGKVWVESGAGNGTTFFVELPRDARASERMQGAG